MRNAAAKTFAMDRGHRCSRRPLRLHAKVRLFQVFAALDLLSQKSTFLT